jgi:hypothetical protein
MGGVVGLVSDIVLLFGTAYAFRPPLRNSRIIPVLIAKILGLPALIGGVGWDGGKMLQVSNPVVFRTWYWIIAGLLVLPGLLWVLMQVIILIRSRET